jgi:glutamate racemase
MKLEAPSTSSLADSELPPPGRPRLAVLDSGVGGLPYLDWIFRKRAGGGCLYLADTEGFPYGSRTEDELVSLVTQRVQALTECFDPDLFLIACNTASVIALSALRETFDKPFVGVVPAVKPAAEQSRNRRIGLIATHGTVVNGYTDRLIRDYAANCRVVRYDGQRLVDFVENEFSAADPAARRAAVLPACKFFLDEGVDSLVLGCTHFIHLIDEFRLALGSRVSLIDSVEGVGRQVLRRLAETGIGEEEEKSFRIYTSGPVRGRSYDDFAALYGAVYKGILPCP